MLANARMDGNESLVDVTTAAGQKFTLAIDSTTNRACVAAHTQ